MKQINIKAAASPRNALFILWGVGLVGLVCVLATSIGGLVRHSDPVRSVVVITTDIEVDADPFSAMFGKLFGLKSNEITPRPKAIVHGGGSGFLVEGRLLTAYHVVRSDDYGKVVKVTASTFDGRSAEVSINHFDEGTDIADLVISHGELKIPTLHLAERAPRRSESVTEIGHPGMILFVISRGFVVGFDREQRYNIATLDTFGGNSGGPVVNSAGRVVGMTHTILNGSRFTGIGTLQALRNYLFPNETR